MPLLPIMVAVSVAAAPSGIPPNTIDIKMMNLIERRLVIPLDVGALQQFSRKYAWSANSGKVEALFSRGPNRREWLPNGLQERIVDGGCDHIALAFDVRAGKFDYVACTGGLPRRPFHIR
jgi:hypothetical protein